MPMLSLLNSRIGRKMMAPIVRAYQNSVIRELKKTGLRVEDLVHTNQMGDIGKQAVALMPEHAQQRAQDITNKHVYLSDAQQKLQQTTKQEMFPILAHLYQRQLERETYK